MRFAGLAGALLAAASPIAAQPPAAPVFAQPAAEAEIARWVNDYRAGIGLPPVPRSPSLSRVARAHATDLATYRPDSGTDRRGLPCNMHSWSGNGPWRPVCYTGDHHYGALMWSKPAELTGGLYAWPGYEISAGGAAPTISAAQATGAWLSSSAHMGVIAERGIWDGARWQAMGVGVSGGYAVIWFGKVADPARD